MGSAAVLQYFGQINGNAQFDQAVTFGDSSNNQETYSFDGNTNTGGDRLVSDEYQIKSNQDEPVPVLFETQYKNNDASEPQYEDQSNVNGLTTTHELFYERDQDGGDFSVSHSIEEPIADRGNYSVRLYGTSTGDYLIYQLAVPEGVDLNNDVLSMEAELGEDHDPASAFDEVYLYEGDGDTYAILSNGNSNSGSYSLNLSSATYASGSTPDLSDVEAIGLGYGDGSNAYNANDGNETSKSFDVTVDAVAVGQSSNSLTYLTEPETKNQVNLIRPTGNNIEGTVTVAGDEYEYQYDAQYSFQTVTESSTALTGDYDIRTGLVPR